MHEPRRLRSHAFSLGLVGVLAFALSGCGSTSQTATRRCVDQDTNTVVADNLCAAGTPTTRGRSSTGRRYGYYYGGRVRNNTVSGGSYSAPSRVETGGFGAQGSKRSGG